MKKKILILTLSDLKYDARVRRQVQALKEDYNITLCGFSGEHATGYELINIAPTKLTLWRKLLTSFFLLFRFHSIAFRILHAYLPILKSKFNSQQFDLIIANDVETLPLAFSLPGEHKVIFDAHEYAPRHFEDKLMWRIFFKPFNIWLCRTYIPLTSGMMTVGRGLALEYKKHFNATPVVVPNATNYFELNPSPVDEKKIKLVHIGIANPSRKLELMIDMMSVVDDRFELDLYLLTPGFASVKTKRYIDDLKKSIINHPKVKIYPPLKSMEVVKMINKYDMGIFLLPPINFNYENTLPNKLFDFIQARLAVGVGPTPEMAEIIRKYNNGVVSEDFSPIGLAKKLNGLTKKDIELFKANSSLAARELNAENNNLLIKKMVASVLGITLPKNKA